MREIFSQLLRSIQANQPVAYCRLVETRGSTPQKAGALMLVYENGTQAGTLGGGCVEAEVKRRAIVILSEGRSELCTFQLDRDYGWDDGLICGGRMTILIEAIVAPGTRQYYRSLAERAQVNEGFTQAVCILDGGLNSTSTTSFFFDADGKQVATSNGEVAPAELVREIKPLMARPRPYVAKGVAYLPLLPRCRLLIVGGGHVGKAVADLAVDLDFEVWVYDDRQDYVSAERFPRVDRRITGPLDSTLREIEITPNTYVLIVTRGHQNDEEALYHLATRGARYVGLIGSRRKIKMIFEDLSDEGVPRESLEQVYAPLGIEIGSQTVEEIAISIAAELIAHRNLGSVPGRPVSVLR
jgi:xanthine dehydrogenase accessory factor